MDFQVSMSLDSLIFLSLLQLDFSCRVSQSEKREARERERSRSTTTVEATGRAIKTHELSRAAQSPHDLDYSRVTEWEETTEPPTIHVYIQTLFLLRRTTCSTGKLLNDWTHSRRVQHLNGPTPPPRAVCLRAWLTLVCWPLLRQLGQAGRRSAFASRPAIGWAQHPSSFDESRATGLIDNFTRWVRVIAGRAVPPAERCVGSSVRAVCLRCNNIVVEEWRLGLSERVSVSVPAGVADVSPLTVWLFAVCFNGPAVTLTRPRHWL